MTTQEIIENNKLIAEFMGYIDSGDPEFLTHPETNYDHSINDLSWFKYHSSWDWLMPVVEKIDTIGFDVQISGISVAISRMLENDNQIVSLVCGDTSKKLGLCFQAVVEFVKWYNENK